MRARLIQFLLIVSSLLLAGGMAVEGRTAYSPDLRALGVLGVLVALGEHRLRRTPRESASYELGHIEGFREGYEEGRRARPAVVPFAVPGAAVCDGPGSVTERRRPGSPMRTLPESVPGSRMAGTDSGS